jgi:hypothetical protein
MMMMAVMKIAMCGERGDMTRHYKENASVVLDIAVWRITIIFREIKILN